MKKLSAGILTLLLLLGELVFPLHIFGGTGITAAAAENTDISFISETVVPDNGAAAWPGPEAFNVLSFTEKDLAFPFGYAVVVESAEDVAKNFFLSEEFINKGLDNENYVETLYQTFMDRASDEAGKTDWVGRLNSGISREEVLEGFSRSSEFSEILKGFGL